MKFYHGGPASLKPGDFILPAREAGYGRLEAKGPNQPNYNPDFIYVTKRRSYAQVFAALQGGAVFEVEVIGTYGPDPDAADSFKARRARIKRIVTPAPAPMPEVARAANRAARQARP